MKLFIYRLLLKVADSFTDLTRKADGAAQRLLPARQVSLAHCEAQKWQNVRPCFVLSTGRSGTLLLSKLLSLSPHVAVAHQPRPELIRASKLAFEKVKIAPEVFRETFKSAREELLLEVLRHDQIFVETNNRITFFSPIIRDVFPHARFIHLVRHPGDFVRSGIRRGWYSEKHEHDIGRIVPTSQARNLWAAWTLIEKIGWLWNETNLFIEEVKSAVPPDDFLFVKAEDLFADAGITRDIFSFLGTPAPSLNAIAKNLRPENVQKKGDYPPYREWPDEDKQSLHRIAPLMEDYGYV
ncbi:sulfotransferase [candidate division KSB1 bacterium]|nr:sulfotransferase [candidate division KSB1 bacterium]